MIKDGRAIKQLQDMVAALMAQGALHSTELKDVRQVIDTTEREVAEAKRWSKSVDGAFDKVVCRLIP